MALFSLAILKGVASALPTDNSTLTAGRLYFTTDTHVVMRDNGTSWDNVSPVTSIPDATTTSLGIVQPDGATIDVSAGVISVPTATTSLLGLVKPDGTTVKVASGVVSVPTATTSALGLVKPDSTTIAITAGVISVIAGATVALKTNGTSNGSQAELNLVAGSNVTLTDDGTGDITVNASGGSGGFGLPLTLPSANGGTTYSLPSTPSTPAASMYFVRGLKWQYGVGNDYTISGSTLTILNTAEAAQTGDVHELYAT